jgi:hypothetical protein
MIDVPCVARMARNHGWNFKTRFTMSLSVATIKICSSFIPQGPEKKIQIAKACHLAIFLTAFFRFRPNAKGRGAIGALPGFGNGTRIVALNIVNLLHTQIIASATNSALSAYALRHSVGLGLYRARNHIENGSGTLLKFESRYFIATAVHCIKWLDLANIRIAYCESKYSDRFTLVRKGTLGGEKGDRHDVGYLELDKRVVHYTLAEFLTLDQVTPEHDAVESLVFLFGFPSEIVPKNEVTKQRRFRLRYLGLQTLMAKPDSIPPSSTRILISC